jgi:hypothetical protein
MTLVGEIERTELVNQLVATIGEGPAETLMKCVLPEGRDQVATKDDLRVLSAELRAEFAKQTRVLMVMLVAFVAPLWAAMAAQFFV